MLDDADLERAVKIGVQARLNNRPGMYRCQALSSCTKISRMRSRQRFSEAFRQVKIGDPLDESTTLGPLSSKDALDTLSKQVDEAVKNRR